MAALKEWGIRRLLNHDRLTPRVSVNGYPIPRSVVEALSPDPWDDWGGYLDDYHQDNPFQSRFDYLIDLSWPDYAVIDESTVYHRGPDRQSAWEYLRMNQYDMRTDRRTAAYETRRTLHKLENPGRLAGTDYWSYSEYWEEWEGRRGVGYLSHGYRRNHEVRRLTKSRWQVKRRQARKDREIARWNG